MKKKELFTPRHCVHEVPFGWTQTEIRGKHEWRCPDIQKCLKFDEYRRCSHACEKRHIKYHRRHIYTIPQSEDPDFPKEILKKSQKDNQTQFNNRYIKELAILSGKMDISCKKASSDAMRIFSINLLNEGYQLAKNTGLNDIRISKYSMELPETNLSIGFLLMVVI